MRLHCPRQPPLQLLLLQLLLLMLLLLALLSLLQATSCRMSQARHAPGCGS